MPRPPILPTIDWETVFEGGQDYETWLKGGESPDNQAAMESLRAALELPPAVAGFLGALDKPVHVIAIAEDWCGDVVRHVPMLRLMEEACPHVRVRFIARADHPDVFARFLTNGGEAIPKFVFLSDQFVECGSWGPMPYQCREYISRGKGCGDVGAARKLVGQAYEADPGQEIIATELAGLIDIAGSKTPDPADCLFAQPVA
jgi:thioredoxin family protein